MKEDSMKHMVFFVEHKDGKHSVIGSYVGDRETWLKANTEVSRIWIENGYQMRELPIGAGPKKAKRAKK